MKKNTLLTITVLVSGFSLQSLRALNEPVQNKNTSMPQTPQPVSSVSSPGTSGPEPKKPAVPDMNEPKKGTIRRAWIQGYGGGYYGYQKYKGNGKWVEVQVVYGI